MPTLGKVYRLQKCATPEGKFVMFALDHRNNLRHALNPAAPDSVTYEQLAPFKQHLTTVMSPTATGILLDPQFGTAPAIANNILARSTGLLIALEKTGYVGQPTARRSQTLPDWSIDKIARLGADGVKLLVYYHPEAPNAAEQEQLVAQVAESCQAHDLPFFLEPLSFSLDPNLKKLPSSAKRAVVVETARRLTLLGVDVLKAEFPLNIADEKDETVWAEACEELSQASAAPWVLLSAGVNFAEFARQTTIACQAGASGVLVGRAVWKEAVSLPEAERDTFLRTVATDRMAQLSGIISQHARPWPDFHPNLREQVGPEWYQTY